MALGYFFTYFWDPGRVYGPHVGVLWSCISFRLAAEKIVKGDMHALTSACFRPYSCSTPSMWSRKPERENFEVGPVACVACHDRE